MTARSYETKEMNKTHGRQKFQAAGTKASCSSRVACGMYPL
ncbi:hypothetical protein QSI_3889 [Clostridioides difficile P28]|nr:hypothetical protein QSI_3889 [Clostridioides difficile P28]